MRLALAAGKPDEATTYLRRYVAAVGDDFDGLLQAADLRPAIAPLGRRFDLASQGADQKFHEKEQRILGLVYLHRGDYAKAAEHLDKADPDDEVLTGLIRANLALGRCARPRTRPTRPASSINRVRNWPTDCERVRRLLQRRQRWPRQQPAPAGKEREWAGALDRVVCCGGRARRRVAPDAATALIEPIFAKGLESGPAFALRGRAAFGKGRLTAALADAERAVEADAEATPAATTSAVWSGWSAADLHGRWRIWRRRAS